MADITEGRIELNARVKNSSGSSRTLRLEPWGDEHELAPGRCIDLVITGPGPGRLEIQLESEVIVLWGWTGSVIGLESE